jgi:hypothetical protein
MENLGVKDVQFEELLALEPDDLRQIRHVTALRSWAAATGSPHGAVYNEFWLISSC